MFRNSGKNLVKASMRELHRHLNVLLSCKTYRPCTRMSSKWPRIWPFSSIDCITREHTFKFSYSRYRIADSSYDSNRTSIWSGDGCCSRPRILGLGVAHNYLLNILKIEDNKGKYWNNWLLVWTCYPTTEPLHFGQ